MVASMKISVLTRSIFITGILLFSVTSLHAETPAEQKKIMAQVKIDQKLGSSIPLNLSFKDETGASVQLSSFFNHKPVIITPVYYKCPMLCSLTLTELLTALKSISYEPGRDFEIVTFSINPQETPELAKVKKANYVEAYKRRGAQTGWHFLTGDQETIHELTSALGFHYAYDEKSGEYAHASSVIVTTPTGVISRYFAGIGISPRDLRLGMVDASQGKLGSAVDHLLLMCYHYDPTTGKYGLVISKVIRLAGILTAVLLFGGIGLALRSESRKNQESSKTAL